MTQQSRLLVKMNIHVFSEGTEVEDRKVTLAQAFALLEKQSFQEQIPDNFIGFSEPFTDDIIIQFQRIDAEEWVLDVPTFQDGRYRGSLSAPITHHVVFSLVRDFFDKNSKQYTYLESKNYSKLIDYCRETYSISLDMIDQDLER